eukprot:7530500-Alexandrium_andersonii.AAC.1
MTGKRQRKLMTGQPARNLHVTSTLRPPPRIQSCQPTDHQQIGMIDKLMHMRCVLAMQSPLPPSVAAA